MSALHYRRFWLSIGVLLIGLVIVLSLLPAPQAALPPSLQDKTGHVIAYFVLTLWFCGLWPRQAHLWIAILFMGLGIGLEALQSFVPSRFFDQLDMVANSVGALAGLALARLGLDRWARMTEKWVLRVLGPLGG